MIKNQWSQKGKTGINVHENMHNPPSHQQASRHFCKILKVVVKTELDIWSTESVDILQQLIIMRHTGFFLRMRGYGAIFGKVGDIHYKKSEITCSFHRQLENYQALLW